MQEIWKDIKGFEGLYKVSNLGKVKRIKRKIKNQYIFKGEKDINYILKGNKNQKGYLQVKLFKDDEAKNYLIHRLVAETFIPNPNNYSQINHIDENKQNNCIDNLEWCTCNYNNNYGTKKQRLKLNHNPIIYNYVRKPVIQYDKDMNKIAEFISIIDANKVTKISFSNISSVCSGKRRTAGGYIWKYKKTK